MPYYLIETAYSADAAKALIATPQDRLEAVKAACQSLGGSLVSLYFAFGEYDVVTIAQLPDNEAAAAMALAVGSSGALSRYRTTVLMAPEEAVRAMKKARDASYAAPR
jgi:uncharacterized protein with GYD domain